MSESESLAEQSTQAATHANAIRCRGVRGATSVTENSADAILEATRDLLERMIRANGIELEDIASVWFTMTSDLNAEYPALAARQIGWHDIALMCSHEISVPHGLPLCIRVLLHWNTPRTLSEIQHIYLRNAVNLRPDRSIALTPEPTHFSDR